MAERRMYSKKITDSDAFTEMSSAAQALYFHLNQGADDDGFNNQIQMAMFKAHASTDDLKILMAKNFIIRFESGVIVIKHWRMHNTIRKDRYTPTNFQEELEFLGIKDNGAYTLGCQVVAERLPSGCQVVAERLPSGCQVVATGKDRVGEDRIVKDSINYQLIADMYNDTCVSFPRLTVLSDKRKQAIKARLNTYTVEQFKEMFEKAESSDFLKGANNKDWQANFDWMIKDANFAKILDGNYDNKKGQSSPQQQQGQGTGNIFVDMLIERGTITEGDINI